MSSINILLKEKIQELYFKKNLTTEDIFRELRCSRKTIYKVLKKGDKNDK